MLYTRNYTQCYVGEFIKQKWYVAMENRAKGSHLQDSIIGDVLFCTFELCFVLVMFPPYATSLTTK